MTYVKGYNDVENPAIAKLGAPKSVDVEQVDADNKRTCRFWRKGWFWACAVAITTICIAAPIGVQTTRRLNSPVEGKPQYKFTGSRGLNTSVLSSYDPAWGLDPKGNLTCDLVAGDMPTGTAPEGAPPPALKFEGGRLVTAEGGKEVIIHGVNWFGFNNGKTFVDGLDAEQTPSWEGGDFATVVYTLKLLGFNAVRLPFLFADLSLPPEDYSKECPDKAPSAEDLAQRATNPMVKQSNTTIPYTNHKPTGSKTGRCNAYVPNEGSTLARYLWTVQYFVAHGFYVVIDYHPFGVDLETTVTNSVPNYTSAWMKLWMSLKCLPNWSKDLKGRILLDLMNEPDAMGIVWGGNADSKQAALEDYYFAVMDAVNAQSPGQALFMVQGGGQERLGSNWGDGFVTDEEWIQARNLSDANMFFEALASKSYKNQVAMAPHMYGPSISGSPDVGPDLWQKLAVSWGYLLKPGYCSSDSGNSSCQAYPVIIGEIGSSFLDPADGPYMKDLAAYMNNDPRTNRYSTAKASNWFWWAYNANSADTGGLINDDWQTLDWTKLQWLQDNLGLTPWYNQ